jgi:uncharacterized RDD family membrane protein YckC
VQVRRRTAERPELVLEPGEGWIGVAPLTGLSVRGLTGRARGRIASDAGWIEAAAGDQGGRARLGSIGVVAAIRRARRPAPAATSSSVGGMMSHEWAPPNATEAPMPEAETTPFTASGAAFGIRAVARVIDEVVMVIPTLLAVVLSAVALVALELAGVIAPGWADRFTESSWTPLVLLGSTVYQAISEGLSGSSVGKQLVGLRVVTLDGGPVDLHAAVTRNLGFLIDGMFVGFIGWLAMRGSERRQRLGDQWADTMVVTLEDEPETTRRPGKVILGGIGLGGLAATVAVTVAKVVWVAAV